MAQCPGGRCGTFATVPYLMASRHRLNLLIACTLLLAVQFILPPAARAGHGAPMTELCLPVAEDLLTDTDPDDPYGSSSTLFLALLLGQRSDGPLGQRPSEADRPGCAMMPVAGLQPSAP